MCGIAGIVNFSENESQINLKILKSMSDVIIHRGPDSEGQWISQDHLCGFAFRRLAIIDLSDAGNQPMTTKDGRFTIVFNGEIYNHSDIRQELEKKGYVYSSQTDTETILYGYMEYGKGILQKLTGMFAFAIWDSDRKELFVARDRIGIKPLYFTDNNGKLIFGSEIKSILHHPSISPELNQSEITNYLNYGMSGNCNSLFKDINKLRSGHYLIFNKKDGLSINRYWIPINLESPYTTMDSTEIEQEVLRLLRLAIKDRMMSDVPFGVFLSGGIDSSLNVALMYELMDRPIDTYSVGFKELAKYNELEYANKIADIFKTNHHEILIDEKDAFPILEDLVWHEDEPNADPVCMPLYFLSKLTRNSGTIVIQVGEGSDEQFVGYPWMMREYNFFRTYWSYFAGMPKSVQKAVYTISKPLFEKSKLSPALDYMRRAMAGEQLYWGGSSIFSPTDMDSLLTENFKKYINEPAKLAERLHSEALSFFKSADYLQRILYVELNQRLAEILLMRVDKIGMAHSIEARVPFLDHRLVEFTMSIPPDLKTPDKKTTKYILKNAIKDILPDEIIHRKKQGFWAPVNEWLRNGWHDFAKDKVLNSSLNEYGIFNNKEIDRMFEMHHSAKRNYGLKLFSLLTLSLWHERFFGK
jgi:asparagine synthase (glutamine-hydrolysing)